MLLTCGRVIHKVEHDWCIYACVCVCCMWHVHVGGDDWTININGRILTLNVSDTQAENEDNEPVNGHVPQYITRLLVGGEICDPYDNLSNTM